MTPDQLSTAKLILETRLRSHTRANPVSTQELLATLRLNRIVISPPALRDLISREIVPALAEENVCLVSTQADGYWAAVDEKDAISVYVVGDSTLKRAQTGLANSARYHKWAAQWNKLQEAK